MSFLIAVGIPVLVVLGIVSVILATIFGAHCCLWLADSVEDSFGTNLPYLHTKNCTCDRHLPRYIRWMRASYEKRYSSRRQSARRKEVRDQLEEEYKEFR